VDWSWIESQKRETLKGNWYWGESKSSLFNNDVDNTLLVYKLKEKENPSDKNLFRIQHYFLEKRKSYSWNTYEASRIIETILPSLLNQKSNEVKPELQINEKIVNNFPFETTITDTTKFFIKKTGSAPIYFSIYQQHWNPKPKRVESDLVINTNWKNDLGTLKAGKPVKMEIRVEVKKDAEYIMIRIPIPAGCSYQSRSQSNKNGEVHREYDVHEVRLYCESLRAGTYSYTIELLPRYAGNYTLNPAKVEWMYFPVIYGREELKKTVIE